MIEFDFGTTTSVLTREEGAIVSAVLHRYPDLADVMTPKGIADMVKWFQENAELITEGGEIILRRYGKVTGDDQ